MAKYQELNREINKIIALDIFKKKLINNIIKYFAYHNVKNQNLLFNIKKQMNNNFPNWFFNMNNKGKIKKFIPLELFDIQHNLDYIFKDRNIRKIKDFDKELLMFKINYVKNITFVIDIQINITNNVTYTLITSNSHRTLLSISNYQYNRLKRLYSGPSDKFDEYLSIILARYQFLGGMNNHLSVPPIIYEHLNINFELFGTPLNTNYDHYCSPFFDYEQYFGSSGSFFNLQLNSNFRYAANPPFNTELIEKMSTHLLSQLNKNTNLVIYLTIPQWNDDFKGFDIINKSSYIIYKKILESHKYLYYDFYHDNYVNVINTYFILLSNNKILDDKNINLDIWCKKSTKYKKE